MKTRGMMWVSITAIGLMAAMAQGWSYNPEQFTIAHRGGGGMGTRMAGNFVVWQDMMGMQWYGYDLAAGGAFTIAGGSAMMLISNESYAVWQDNIAMNWYGYELAERRKFSLGISDVDGMSTRLTGQFLVYKGMMDAILYGIDLESEETFEIASGDIDGMSIRAAGDYVVWRTMTMPPTLAGYQLSTRQSFLLAEGEIDSMSMAMSGQFVAWKEWAMEEPMVRLYGYDLAGREKFLITNEDMDSMSLKAAGPYIIGRHTMSGVLYGFDGLSREIFEIGENVDGMSLFVNERYAAWKDVMSMRVYGFDLPGRQQVETDVESMYSYVLSGSYIFYFFYDPDLMTTELRGFDLATGEGFTVALISSGGMMMPIADGDYVAWSDSIPPSADTGLLGARIWKLPNDLCEEAVEVAAGVPYRGDSSGATGTDRSSCGFEDNRDVWFVFRPAAGGVFTMDAHSEAFDTTLAAFEACTGAETACNDDANLETTDSRLVMTLVKGKQYLFRLAGYDGSGGPYELTISRGSCAAPPQADLTGDCKVNLEDLAVMASQWLDCGLDPADLCL
ncbi:MAG: hypothetical protein JW828_14795 [Sedimentisphaerales bacterium]|nr:hypothetical protein [Sedimentisphaerales bacterium]